MEFTDFLIQAKRNAYLGKNGEPYETLEDGCREFTFSEDNLVFRNRYFGRLSFTGEEIVFSDKKPYWAMNYCGEVLNDLVSEQEVFDFLAKTLSEGEKRFPFRGPKFLSKKEFVYINHIEGELKRFKGEEFILFNGEKVYRMYYFGGFLR